MMNAIILAAGLGTRLKPITDYIPKPLLPIVNRPIIEINIQRLYDAGVKNIGINLFHKADMLKKFLNISSPNLDVVVENTLRGTGGALDNFRDLIKDDVIVHNCDVLSAVDIDKVIAFHKFHKSLATLILTKSAGTNFIKLDRNNRIKKITAKEYPSQYTYAGIALVSGQIAQYLPHEDFFSIIDVYKKLVKENRLIMGFPMNGIWREIGTHNSYWNVHREILHRNIVFDEIEVSPSIAIHASSLVKTKNLEGFVSIGSNCFISEKVRLKNTIVFEHSKISEGEYENCLLSDKFCIKINEAQGYQQRL